MNRLVLGLLCSLLIGASSTRAADGERTVAKAATALHEIMAVPLKGIPASLLADAEPPAQPVRQRLGFVGRLSREPDEGRWGRRARAVRADRPTGQPTAGATDQP